MCKSERTWGALGAAFITRPSLKTSICCGAVLRREVVEQHAPFRPHTRLDGLTPRECFNQSEMD